MNVPNTQVYAVMNGTTVENVIVASAEFATGKANHVRIDHLVPRPGPGWSRAGGKWSEPVDRSPKVQMQLPEVSLDHLIPKKH